MRVGVLLEHDRAIAAVRGGRRAPIVVPFDPEHPGACVATLRAAIGDAAAIRLAIGLAFLEPADPALPPVDAEARHQMLSLEPDRWFARVGASAAVALVGDGPLAFATDSVRLSAWLSAFEQWGSIEAVEPAPCAIARAMHTAGSGELLVAAAPGETGVLCLASGRLMLARRVPSGTPPPALARDCRDASHAADGARGLMLSDDVPAHGQLLPASARRALARRRRLGILFAWGALAASLGFASLAAERWRERTLQAVDTEIARVQPAADAALALRARLDALRGEAQLVAQTQRDPSHPSRVMAVLARRLPGDAVLSMIRGDSTGWEVGGVARDASAVLRALALDSAFVDVHAVGGTNRSGGAHGTEESFTVAFRVRGGDAPR